MNEVQYMNLLWYTVTNFFQPKPRSHVIHVIHSSYASHANTLPLLLIILGHVITVFAEEDGESGKPDLLAQNQVLSPHPPPMS